MLLAQQELRSYPLPKKTSSNETQAWNAVLERDRRYDGMFVYAVRSTGVYCRPSCPSRRPRPEQVEFFEQPKAAESAGYRSCRRCRPTENGTSELSATITQVCRFIDQSTEDSPTLDRLAELVQMSPFHLQRTFKQALGISPRQYAELRRFLRFRTRLQNGDDVTTAMYEAGFNSPSRLYEHSTSALGMTPSVYRAGGRGLNIRFAVSETKLGHMLVAATESGVCAVRFGESAVALEKELRQEFSEAAITTDDRRLASFVKDISKLAEGKPATHDVPLDIRHTAFQAKVWRVLRNIEPGKTKSYREVAREIGDPNAVRAVARACATNPVALVIPCHRVVRSDGNLSGYRWGVERKRKILEGEKEWKQ